MITLKEFWMGRDAHFPPDDKMKFNADEIVRRANILLTLSDMERGVRSGYRPASINSLVPNASPHSKHMTCEAIDIEDNDGKLKSWCLANLDQLEKIGLWIESPEYTPSWLHCQIVAPASCHRVFIP